MDFLIGIVVGSLVVGSSVMRTLGVDRKDQRLTFFASILNGASYYASVRFNAGDNVLAFLGTVIGSTITVCWMARK
jgi:hypothetical protein